MEKRNLAKLALAALVLASNLPSGVQASTEDTQASGVLLAAGCGGHGCNGSASRRNEIADTTTTTGSSYFNPNTNAYQTGAGTSSYNTGYNNTGVGTSGYNTSGYGAGANGYNTGANGYNTGTSGYNTGAGTNGYSNYGTGTSTYSNPASSSTYGNPSSGYSTSTVGGNQGRTGTYSSDWNTDVNRGASTNWNANRSYGTDVDSQMTTGRSNVYGTTTTISISDEEFRKQLNPDVKKIFDNLNRTGKDLAKGLTSDPSFKDKNAAVKEAQRRVEGGSSSTMYGQ